jgi:hypothetical protein
LSNKKGDRSAEDARIKAPVIIESELLSGSMTQRIYS